MDNKQQKEEKEKLIPQLSFISFLSPIPKGDSKKDIRQREKTIQDILGFPCQKPYLISLGKGKSIESLLGYFMLLREITLLEQQ